MTYLIDTSVWVEFLHSTGTPAARLIREFVGGDMAVLRACPPVRMELACERNDIARYKMLKLYDNLLTTGVDESDFDIASEIYRAVRLTGHTVRSQIDCVIASVALRVGATVVHRDVDFDRIGDAVRDLSVLRVPEH